MILSLVKKPRTNYLVNYFVEYLPWTFEMSLCFQLGSWATCEVSGKIVVRIWTNSSNKTAIVPWHQVKNPRKLNPLYFIPLVLTVSASKAHVAFTRNNYYFFAHEIACHCKGDYVLLVRKETSASSYEDLDYAVPSGCFSSKLPFKLKWITEIPLTGDN